MTNINNKKRWTTTCYTSILRVFFPCNGPSSYMSFTLPFHLNPKMENKTKKTKEYLSFRIKKNNGKNEDWFHWYVLLTIKLQQLLFKSLWVFFVAFYQVKFCKCKFCHMLFWSVLYLFVFIISTSNTHIYLITVYFNKKPMRMYNLQ